MKGKNHKGADFLVSADNIPRLQTFKATELEEVRLDMRNLSDSDESIIKLEDEQSEYKKSQTFRQVKDLGNLTPEIKQKIQELNRTVVAAVDAPASKYTENRFTHLPSIGENVYGYNVQRIGFKINYGMLFDSIIISVVGYLLSFIVDSFLSGIMTFLIYLIADMELFSDGLTVLDTVTPVSYYKAIEKVPASANIIYEELVEGGNIEKYNIMLKRHPYTIHEDSKSHLKIKKLVFELPETLPYKSL